MKKQRLKIVALVSLIFFLSSTILYPEITNPTQSWQTQYFDDPEEKFAESRLRQAGIEMTYYMFKQRFNFRDLNRMDPDNTISFKEGLYKAEFSKPRITMCTKEIEYENGNELGSGDFFSNPRIDIDIEPQILDEIDLTYDFRNMDYFNGDFFLIGHYPYTENGNIVIYARIDGRFLVHVFPIFVRDYIVTKDFIIFIRDEKKYSKNDEEETIEIPDDEDISSLRNIYVINAVDIWKSIGISYIPIYELPLPIMNENIIGASMGHPMGHQLGTGSAQIAETLLNIRTDGSGGSIYSIPYSEIKKLQQWQAMVFGFTIFTIQVENLEEEDFFLKHTIENFKTMMESILTAMDKELDELWVQGIINGELKRPSEEAQNDPKQLLSFLLEQEGKHPKLDEITTRYTTQIINLTQEFNDVFRTSLTISDINEETVERLKDSEKHKRDMAYTLAALMTEGNTKILELNNILQERSKAKNRAWQVGVALLVFFVGIPTVVNIGRVGQARFTGRKTHWMPLAEFHAKIHGGYNRYLNKFITWIFKRRFFLGLKETDRLITEADQLTEYGLIKGFFKRAVLKMVQKTELAATDYKYEARHFAKAFKRGIGNTVSGFFADALARPLFAVDDLIDEQESLIGTEAFNSYHWAYIHKNVILCAVGTQLSWHLTNMVDQIIDEKRLVTSSTPLFTDSQRVRISNIFSGSKRKLMSTEDIALQTELKKEKGKIWRSLSDFFAKNKGRITGWLKRDRTMMAIADSGNAVKKNFFNSYVKNWLASIPLIMKTDLIVRHTVFLNRILFEKFIGAWFVTSIYFFFNHLLMNVLKLGRIRGGEYLFGIVVGFITAYVHRKIWTNDRIITIDMDKRLEIERKKQRRIIRRLGSWWDGIFNDQGDINEEVKSIMQN